MPPARRVALPGGGWLNLHEQAGEGPTLLFLHGFTDCAESFRLMLPHLAGCHVVLPDLRGHGGSFRGPIPSLATLAGDIEALVAALGLRRPVVTGHSMGALVAVTLAARGKVDLLRLVTLSGSLRPDGPALQALAAQFAGLPSPLAMDHPFLDEWYACSRPVAPAFLEGLRRNCVAMRREDWRDCLAMLARADLTAEAGAVRLPVLAISGAEDMIFPAGHHRHLARALRPERDLVLEGVGHNPHWEKPAQIAALVRDFVGSVAAG
ncbi:alpha/beta fold hydrolase [Paragemmobacter straminiformis]|nr:alpha/beta hydrolase [Gemmobacter straminiformis]